MQNAITAFYQAYIFAPAGRGGLAAFLLYRHWQRNRPRRVAKRMPARPLGVKPQTYSPTSGTRFIRLSE